MKTKLLNFAYKTITFSLFSISAAGAYFVGSGAYGIITRRMEYTKSLKDQQKDKTS